MSTTRRPATGRYLAYVLRHAPQAAGITLDAAGWVSVDELLAGLARAGRALDRAGLERLVAEDAKGRYQLDGERIRAAQGHSVPVDLDLPVAVPPGVLFHGTVERFLPAILAEGLRPGQRHDVHLSADAATARAVGGRRGTPVVLRVDAAAMHADGLVFRRSANGVWLTASVPPRYLTRLPGDADGADGAGGAGGAGGAAPVARP